MKMRRSGNVTLDGLLMVLLAVAFMVLKLTGAIDWRWIWITAPLWAGFAMACLIAFGAFVWTMSGAIVGHYAKQKTREEAGE